MDDSERETPLFSVIIPVYRTEKYLRQCIDSVLNQTVGNIEIICVNDGSPDNSLDVLREYESSDSRVIILNQKNGGLSVARNSAMEVARGTYILFLDSDDWLAHESLALLHRKIIADEMPDMVMFASQLFYEDTGESEPFNYTDFASFMPTELLQRPFRWKDLLDTPRVLWRLPVSACTTMYRKEFVKEHNLVFPQGLCFEDNLFYHKALIYAESVSIESGLLYCRRKHSASITANRSKYFEDLCKIRLLEYAFMSELNDKRLLQSFLGDFALGNLRYWYLILERSEREQNYPIFRLTMLKLLRGLAELSNDSYWGKWFKLLGKNPNWRLLSFYRFYINLRRSLSFRDASMLFGDEKRIIKSLLNNN